MSGWIRCSRYLAWWTALFSDGVVQPHFLGHVEISLQEMFSANLNHLKSSSIAGKWCFMPHVSRHIKTPGDGGERCVAWAEHKSSWQKGIPTAKLQNYKTHIMQNGLNTFKQRHCSYPRNLDSISLSIVGWRFGEFQQKSNPHISLSSCGCATLATMSFDFDPTSPQQQLDPNPVACLHLTEWIQKLKLFHGCPLVHLFRELQRYRHEVEFILVHLFPSLEIVRKP